MTQTDNSFLVFQSDLTIMTMARARHTAIDESTIVHHE